MPARPARPARYFGQGGLRHNLAHAGVFLAGIALMLLGHALRVVDDNLADLDPTP